VKNVLELWLALYLPLHQADGNPLVSRDACGHVCTVTGALWRPDGRCFDGIDDFINTDASVADGKLGGVFTLMCWGRLAKWNTNQNLIGTGSMASPGDYGGFDFNNSDKKIYARTCTGTSGENIVGSIGVFTNDAGWHLFAMTVDEDGHINHFVIDDTDMGSSSIHNNDLSVHTHLYIGQLPYTSPNVNPLKGTVGDVWLYGRELTVREIQRHYLGTKWRYQ
jgi:hypothetical protein